MAWMGLSRRLMTAAFTAFVATSFFTAALSPNLLQAQIARDQPAILSGVGLDEKLGNAIPADLPFLDHLGNRITLADILAEGKPVLLNPLYYECPVLCNLVIDGVARSVRQLDWEPGREYLIVSFTVDTTEGPAQAAVTRERILSSLPHESAAEGWYFLSDAPSLGDGPSASSAILADAIGFRFRPEPRSGEIIHPAAIAFISPAGEITRYLYGFDISPFDMKNALGESADGAIGTPVEQVLMYCYTYDPNSRSYVPLAWNIMKLGGLATALILGIFLTLFWLREQRRDRPQRNSTFEARE